MKHFQEGMVWTIAATDFKLFKTTKCHQNVSLKLISIIQIPKKICQLFARATLGHRALKLICDEEIKVRWANEKEASSRVENDASDILPRLKKDCVRKIVKERLWEKDWERLWKKDCDRKIVKERLQRINFEKKVAKERLWKKGYKRMIVRLWKRDCEREIVKERL